MCPRNSEDLKDAGLVKLMGKQRQQICDNWIEALRGIWAEHAGRKLRLLEKDIECEKDPFSLLVRMMSKNSSAAEFDVDFVLQRVRKSDYSILDFSIELLHLELSIESSLQLSPDVSASEILNSMRSVRNSLSKILYTVLKNTSEVYEKMNQSDGRAFCQMDVDGKIVHANREMRRFANQQSLVGRKFDSFFTSEEKTFVRDTISGKLGEQTAPRKLFFQVDEGKTITVGAEIAPIYISGEYRGAYACMVDLSLQEKTNIDIFDQSPFGIIKVDLSGRFIYANQAAREVFGIDSWKDMDISSIGLNHHDYNKMRTELQHRTEGKPGDYSVHITRMNDGIRVPVKISAIPETDLKGKIVGSTALIRSLHIDEAIKAMHTHVATIRDGKEILRNVAAEIEKVIPYSQFLVSVYNSKMTHIREFFPDNPDDPLLSKVCWWKIPKYLKGWLNNREPESVPDIISFFSRPNRRKLLKKPEIQNLLDRGFQSFLRFPIVKGDKIAATITLFSKEKHAFSENHIKILEDFPLAKAVLMALYYDETKEFRFMLDLIRNISSASNNLKKVAKVITTRVAKHYRWQHVSLFEVDENAGLFRMLSQKYSSKEFRLPPKFTQPTKEGIFNEAYEKNRPINVGNVHTHRKFKTKFEHSLKKTLSELCLPIKTNEFFWLLNIEDDRENAISKEEEKSLLGIVRELKKFLEKCWLYNFLQASLDNASDAVIITDNRNYIKKTNKAAIQLLGSPDEKLVGKPFKTYFKDPQQARDLLVEGKRPSEEVTFILADNKEVSAILSRSIIEENISDKVYFVTDLSLQKRVLELENYWRMYSEIATQTKTPLSLAFGFLNRFKKDVEEGKLPGTEDIDKSLRQLRKVDLSYDRLALYDKRKELKSHSLQFDLLQLVKNVQDDFPESEKDSIKIIHDKSEYDAEGDVYQISFSIKTILSYLLRFLPQREKIRINLREQEDIMELDISANFPSNKERSESGIAHAARMSELEKEMALGDELIKTFINKNNGTYESIRVGDQVFFIIKLTRAGQKK
jgi:PAS domain S-box-containing protein